MRLITILIETHVCRIACDFHLSHSHISNAVPLLLSKRELYTEAHIRKDLVSMCVLPPEREEEVVQSLDTERTYGPHYESHGI